MFTVIQFLFAKYSYRHVGTIADHVTQEFLKSKRICKALYRLDHFWTDQEYLRDWKASMSGIGRSFV